MARILIIEDEGLMQLFYLRALRRDGHDVIILTAGDEAEALSRIRAEPPGLIVLDLCAGAISGASLLRRLRRDPCTADIPVVVITGFGPSRHGLADASPDAVLGKPVSGELLRATVARLLGARRHGIADRRNVARRQLQRLIIEGSDELVEAVYERLVADRHVAPPPGPPPETPTWEEIVQRAVEEGILPAPEGQVLLAEVRAGKDGAHQLFRVIS